MYQQIELYNLYLVHDDVQLLYVNYLHLMNMIRILIIFIKVSITTELQNKCGKLENKTNDKDYFMK